MLKDGRIVNWQVYGQHIPLTCKNHPKLRWNTKNIYPIGCRTIFFNCVYQVAGARECDCTARDLIPINLNNSPECEA